MKSDALSYVRGLLARGRFTFTRSEASVATGRSGAALGKLLQRLRAKGWIVPVGRDFLVVVDPLHQATGSIPPSWFLDDWARHLNIEYYIGGLTAAEWHGAAHQRPQTFQVVVGRSLRAFHLPGIEVQLLFRLQIYEAMWAAQKVPTGKVRVATPEMAAYDLLTLRNACASLDHAATVFVELGEAMSSSRLASLPAFGEQAPLQRLGWLLDEMGWSRLTNGLAKSLNRRPLTWTPLQPGAALMGKRNPRWKIVENTDIQPDLEPHTPS